MPIATPLNADLFRYPLGSVPLTAALDTDDIPDDGYYNALDFNVAQDLGSGPTYHLGEDWNGEGGDDTDLGDPIYAIANGVVIAVADDQSSATTGFGNYVVVRHQLPSPIVIDGQTVTYVHSLYAHLQSAAYGTDQTTPISVGDAIAIDEQIGALGSSGFAASAHLHFEVTLNDTLPINDDGYNPAGAPAGWTDPSDFIDSANTQLATTDFKYITGTPVVVDEGTGLAEFLLHLNTPSALPISVDYATESGTAGSSDYSRLSTATLTFAPGEMLKTLNVAVDDDSVWEYDEYFFLSLSNASNATVHTPLVSALIVDNDGPVGVPAIEVTAPMVNESIGEAAFAITLDRPTTSVVTVDYATEADTADQTDFNATTGTVVFTPGQVAHTVTIPITDDALAEGDERFSLRLSNPVNSTLPDDSASALIAASDQTLTAPPTITGAPLLVDEGASFADFVLRLDAPSLNPISVAYSTADLTAGYYSDDYDHLDSTAHFAPGETLATVRVGILEDSQVELDELFYLDLSNAVNAAIGNNIVIATIVDNDAPLGVPAIDVTAPMVNESIGEAAFAITLDRPTTSVVTVDYATVADTADTTDFSARTGTVVFTPGQVAHTVTIPITDDALVEGDERFSLRLSNPVNATLPDDSASALIAASDQTLTATPTITGAPLLVDEGASFADFVLRLDAPSLNPISVAYSTGNLTASYYTHDYDHLDSTAHFAPGETLATVRVGILEDSQVELDELFYLDLSNAVNAAIGNNIVIATIVDNDAPLGVPAIDVTAPMVNESIGEAAFAITLDRPTTSVVTVDYATEADTADETDFSATTGTVVFTPGQVAHTVTIPITDDALAEGDERFSLRLSNPVISALPDDSASALIAASDQPLAATPTISADPLWVDEGAGFVDFVLRLDAPSLNPISVAYSTGNLTASYYTHDYDRLDSTAHFAPGETLATVRIGILEDSSVEADETFYLGLSAPINAIIGTNAVVATIVDNDVPAGFPVIGISDPVINESVGEAPFAVTLDRPSTSAVTVDHATEADTADTSDFSARSGTLVFTPGEVVHTVYVPITDDLLTEGDERFSLLLSNPVGATLPDTTGTALIGANDLTPTFVPTITADNVIAVESDGFADFALYLDAPSTNAVSVAYYTVPGTAASNDFALIPSSAPLTVNFAPGETAKSVRLTLVDDDIIESPESFSVNLKTPVDALLGTDAITVTIESTEVSAVDLYVSLQSASASYLDGPPSLYGEPPAGFTVWGQPWEDEDTGLFAELYQNENDDDFVLSFRGTERSSADIITDLNLGWPQWEAAKALDDGALLPTLEDLLVDDNRLHITGHSLGGALAQFAAYDLVEQLEIDGLESFASNISLTTWNGLGGEAGLIEAYGAGSYDPAQLGQAQVAHYAHPDDIVARLGDGHVGNNTFLISNDDPLTQYFWTAHGRNMLFQLAPEDRSEYPNITPSTFDYFTLQLTPEDIAKISTLIAEPHRLVLNRMLILQLIFLRSRQKIPSQ